MAHSGTASQLPQFLPAGEATGLCYLGMEPEPEREPERPCVAQSQQKRRYHLISSLQVGADRGGLLGLDDARQHLPEAAGRLTTGGYAPLGFKCDDYIQKSEIDLSPEAAASIESEKKWLRGPINQSVCELIRKFGIQELPDPLHRVKFKAKDLANVDLCDVLVGFRSSAPNSGAGTEQTANYAAFGEYTFVEQFKHGETTGGALQRQALLVAAGWPSEYVKQVSNSKADGSVVEFVKGQIYQVLECFTHVTPLDAQKTAEEGKDVYQSKALTQDELLADSWVWSPKPAARSVLCCTLSQGDGGALHDERDTYTDTDTDRQTETDTDVARQITAFLRRCSSSSEGSEPLKVNMRLGGKLLPTLYRQLTTPVETPPVETNASVLAVWCCRCWSPGRQRRSSLVCKRACRRYLQRRSPSC